MQLDLYRGRPGFQYPYEGPTQTAEENPEGWEAFGLRDRLTHRLAKFTQEEIAGDPS